MRLKFFIGAALAALCLSASADTFSANVIKVIDGDTVTVLTSDKNEMRVRLAGIDCPEKRGNQPFWRSAKSELSALLGNSKVIISYTKKDRWDRFIGVVYLDSRDINAEMIRLGQCWHFKKYAREQSATDRVTYSAHETTARSQRIGLWGDPAAVAPWDWRAGKR